MPSQYDLEKTTPPREDPEADRQSCRAVRVAQAMQAAMEGAPLIRHCDSFSASAEGEVYQDDECCWRPAVEVGLTMVFEVGDMDELHGVKELDSALSEMARHVKEKWFDLCAERDRRRRGEAPLRAAANLLDKAREAME